MSDHVYFLLVDHERKSNKNKSSSEELITHRCPPPYPRSRRIPPEHAGDTRRLPGLRWARPRPLVKSIHGPEAKEAIYQDTHAAHVLNFLPSPLSPRDKRRSSTFYRLNHFPHSSNSSLLTLSLYTRFQEHQLAMIKVPMPLKEIRTPEYGRSNTITTAYKALKHRR